MEIKKLGVVGAGTMGNGVAQIAAQIGCEVVMRDVEERFVENGLKNINRFLSKSVEKGKMTEEQKNVVLGRIKGTTNMADLKDVDFVVEAVIEDLNLKKSVFKELDGICRPEVILGTNTSSMSITEIAVATRRPEKVVGMHFFNPVPLMRLVEVIRGFHTNDETVQVTTDLAKKMGKETVEVKIDSPGFIVNRIMIPHMLEAINIVQEGIATPEDVDKAVKLGLNYPMGPFELMDLTGVDIAKYVSDYFYNELNKESKWVAPTLLKNMIRAGRLGRKTGAGWYEYKKK
jgi:3-hydroxybutyryl-CoA dehydrogenase